MDGQVAMTRLRSLQAVPARILTCLTLACIMVLLLGACGGGSTAPNAPNAHTLISQAQVAIQKVSSYHFTLTVDNPGTGGTLIIKSADGDILVPDKLKAMANVLVLSS